MAQNHGKIMVLHPMLESLESENTRDFFAGVEDVEVVSLSKRKGLIEFVRNREEVALNASDVIAKVKEAEKAGYGAVAFSCWGDPNLYAAREAVRIPVIGPMEVAMHFCSMLGRRFSILTPDLSAKRWQEENAIKYGFESKVASIRLVPFNQSPEDLLPLIRLKPIPEEIIEVALREAIKAIEEDGATAITFGCGIFLPMIDEVKRRLNEQQYRIPVINPMSLAVDVARILIRQKLTHSELCYPYLDQKVSAGL